MQIQRTRRDPSADPNGPPTFVTADTHWWDGSQIYGSDPAFAQALRTGEHGKLKLDERGLIPEEIEAHVDLTGVAGNFWVGLALLHALFMLEHNAICDRLHAKHPSSTDDELYDKARLVNAALMAKIHTVDWTPAIIAHPTTVTGDARQLVGARRRAVRQEVRPPDPQRGVPRHPGLADGPPRRAVLAHRGVRRRLPHAPADPRRVRVPLARATTRARRSGRSPRSACCTCASGSTRCRSPTLLYSFGIAHPGAITLHNFPRFLQSSSGRRRRARPRRDRHRARPRARRPALQRVPPAAPHDAVRTFEELADTRSSPRSCAASTTATSKRST